MPPQIRRRGIFDDEENQTFSPLMFDDDFQNIDQSDQLDDQPSEDDLANEQARPTFGNNFLNAYKAMQSAPEGPANSRYRKFLEEEMPKHEPPGKVNRLAAILGGASEGYFRGAGAGIRTARETLDAPYERQLRDYSIKGRALQGAAELEDKSIGRRASFAGQMATQANADARLEEQQRLHNVMFAKWGQEAATAAIRAANTGVHWETSQVDGRVHGFKTGKDGTVTEFVGPKVGQTMDEKEKANFNNFIKEQRVRHSDRLSEGITLENVRAGNRASLEEQRQTGRMAIRKFSTRTGGRFIEVKNGNIMFFDPSSPDKPVDTGIASGVLTDKDKIELGIEGRITTQDNAALNTQMQRNRDAGIGLEVDRQKRERDATTKAADPRQQFASHQVTMQKFLDKNPSYKPFFHLDPTTGRPMSINRPDDADDETWNNFINAIYPGKK